MIKISFSRDDLLSHSPCFEGLDLFDRCFPSGEATIDLTPFSFVLICTSGFAGWLIERGLLASLSLKGVDLSSADLSDALRYPSDPEIPGWTVVDGRLKKA